MREKATMIAYLNHFTFNQTIYKSSNKKKRKVKDKPFLNKMLSHKLTATGTMNKLLQV
jgi:hypothetical protein